MLDKNLFVVEFPVLSAHGALLLGLGVQPLHDAMDVEAVGAGAPHQRAVVPRELAVRATTIKGHTTYTTVIVVSYPPPSRNARPTYVITVRVNIGITIK